MGLFFCFCFFSAFNFCSAFKEGLMGWSHLEWVWFGGFSEVGLSFPFGSVLRRCMGYMVCSNTPLYSFLQNSWENTPALTPAWRHAACAAFPLSRKFDSCKTKANSHSQKFSTKKAPHYETHSKQNEPCIGLKAPNT